MSFPGFDPVSAANMAYLSMMTSSTSLSTSMQRLSTGLRINSAGDDPAGLAESQVLLSQINSMNQAMRSVQDQTSLTQVASGALTQESSLLQSMLTLATSSATGTLTQTQLAANQAQMNQYAASLTQITNSTTYNGQSLLTGAFQNQQFQVGPNAGDTFSLSINPMDAASLGVAGDAGVVNATQNTANVTSLTGVGNGFVSGSSGEQYKITATSLTGGVAGTIYGAATNTATNTGTVAATVNTANQASAAGNQGSEWMTLSGTAGGAGGGNYLVQVTSVNSDGSVGGVKISSNGGSTWSAPVSGPTFSLTGTGGLNATFATGAAPAQVGDQFSFTVNNNQTGAAAQAAVQSGTNVGRSTITFSGTYTGTANVQYGVRAVSEDGSNTVTGIQVSQDGGKTWSTTIGQTTPGTPTFAIGNGLSVNWATGTFNPSQIATATNNDAYYFNVVAANQTTQVLQVCQCGGDHRRRCADQRRANAGNIGHRNAECYGKFRGAGHQRGHHSGQHHLHCDHTPGCGGGQRGRALPGHRSGRTQHHDDLGGTVRHHADQHGAQHGLVAAGATGCGAKPACRRADLSANGIHHNDQRGQHHHGREHRPGDDQYDDAEDHPARGAGYAGTGQPDAGIHPAIVWHQRIDGKAFGLL